MKATWYFVCSLLFAAPIVAENGPCVIPGRGHLEINVGTSGLFGAFAHDHLIAVEKIEGCGSIDSKDLTPSSIKLTFPATSLKVMDPKESAANRAKIQKTMETDVLRVSEYPLITFESTAIERVGTANQFQVRGTLSIRGKTQPAMILVTLTQAEAGTYRTAGTYKFKQTAFGIKPIQLAGGTIKVKDEVQLNFEIFLK
jgi:polyisoprenoid-binding protein YceI